VLFERYNARICTYLARLVGDDEVGRDLAQDAFVAAWRALPRVMGELRFGPWLYRIATNAARSHLRRARLVRWLPWSEDERDATGIEMCVVGPEVRAGEAEAVKQALAQLAPQCRVCLLLQVEGGFSQREIAELLGISEKSVSAYVSRGREQFRRAHGRLAESDAEDGAREGGPAR
jgi:RNA polymerase sigma-70 factor (ECF subfamily)